MDRPKKPFPRITCQISPRAYALLLTECRRRNLTELGTCTHGEVISDLLETYLAKDGAEPLIELAKKKRAGRPRLSA